MNKQLLSLLGLMRRAGKLSLGFDAAAESAESGESCMILTTADISPKTLKELNYKINPINDKGFAQKAKLLMEADHGEE